LALETFSVAAVEGRGGVQATDGTVLARARRAAGPLARLAASSVVDRQKICCHKEDVALNVKSPEVDRLAAEVARIAGETKTEAVRRALQERLERLQVRAAPMSRRARLRRMLEDELWPQVPSDQLGRRLSQQEVEDVLGYGENGM
jgi:antitoxin VapB